MLEKTVVIDKLKEEGVDEKLGDGVQFETEGELTSWITNLKSAIPDPTKALNEYTEEELKTEADSGNNKVLQGLLDKVRTDATKKAKTEEPPKPGEEKPAWAKKQDEDFNLLKTKIETQETEKTNAEQKTKAIQAIKGHKLKDDADINIVLATLGNDFSDANIKLQSEKHIAYLTDKGLEFKPEHSSGEVVSQKKSLIKKYVDKEKAKTEKFSKAKN